MTKVKEIPWETREAALMEAIADVFGERLAQPAPTGSSLVKADLAPLAVAMDRMAEAIAKQSDILTELVRLLGAQLTNPVPELARTPPTFRIEVGHDGVKRIVPE